MIPSIVLSSASPLLPSLNPDVQPLRRKNKAISSSSPNGPNQLIHLLQGCKSIRQFPQIHAAILKSDHDQHPRLLFKVLRLCAAFQSMDYAAQIFATIHNPDIYHLTALIGGHISNAAHREAIRLYFQMIGEVIEPDLILVSYVLKACASELALEEGRQVHAQALKLGISSERPVKMRLMEQYGKCAQFDNAKLVFGEMPETDAVAATILISCYSDRGLVDEAQSLFVRVKHKDTVCWTAIIDGCVRNGHANVALELFRRMQRENVQPNELTIVCLLSACSQLGALELGRWVHSYVGMYSIMLNTFVGSALIDMYFKCGSEEEAHDVFRNMKEKDVVSYNSMIVGLAMHGRSSEAIKLYTEMIDRGFKPTKITFVGVLNACSHSGRVDVGFKIFNSMTKDYDVKPSIEHYGCMVDLLGRVGLVEEAYDFIKGMKIEPDYVIWAALLSACKIHHNLILGEKVAKFLIDSEVADSGAYVLLSNVYASFGKWDASVQTRAKMRQKGIQKEPGCSSIEVDNQVHEFLLGDIRHPRREAIYKKLEELNDILKLHGYIPSMDVVLHDIEEGEKEWALSIHSERLAICYGLISTKPGTTIRITKNLRVCIDCHSMIKIISKVTMRKIIVRDRNRFHHFQDGSCSCGDYW